MNMYFHSQRGISRLLLGGRKGPETTTAWPSTTQRRRHTARLMSTQRPATCAVSARADNPCSRSRGNPRCAPHGRMREPYQPTRLESGADLASRATRVGMLLMRCTICGFASRPSRTVYSWEREQKYNVSECVYEKTRKEARSLACG